MAATQPIAIVRPVGPLDGPGFVVRPILPAQQGHHSLTSFGGEFPPAVAPQMYAFPGPFWPPPLWNGAVYSTQGVPPPAAAVSGPLPVQTPFFRPPYAANAPSEYMEIPRKSSSEPSSPVFSRSLSVDSLDTDVTDVTADLSAEDKDKDKPKRRRKPLERKYECSLCQKRFLRPSALQTHALSHTGDKPYPCPRECGRRFSVPSNLKRHLRTCPGTSGDADPTKKKEFATLSFHDCSPRGLPIGMDALLEACDILERKEQ